MSVKPSLARDQLPCGQWTRDGRGLHLQHGPIDLVVGCRGSSKACAKAYSAIAGAFDGVLSQLVAELSLLKTPLPSPLQLPSPLPSKASPVEFEGHARWLSEDSTPTAFQYGLNGEIARRMYEACLPYAKHKITPMASVAGAVADHLLGRLTDLEGIDRIWINNGGDIAVYVGPGSTFDCGMITDVTEDKLTGQCQLSVPPTSDQGRYYGIATSGRASFGEGGRSFSLGIADAVTVIAQSAAKADAAATIIANHVDCPGTVSAIKRRPACEMDPDSDLGSRLVVTRVSTLSDHEIDQALVNGERAAADCVNQSLIDAAALSLIGQYRCVGSMVAPQENREQIPGQAVSRYREQVCRLGEYA